MSVVFNYTICVAAAVESVRALTYPTPQQFQRRRIAHARTTHDAKFNPKTLENGQQILMSINSPVNGKMVIEDSKINDGHIDVNADMATTKFIVMNDPKGMNEPSNTCLCVDKPTLTSKTAEVGKPMFCQALDTFDGKMIGCCNQVSLMSLFRPSRGVPFKVFCEVHLMRLRRHHCCPGCGVFCAQGEFLECFAVKKQVHLFHKSCQVVTGLGPKKQLCPHCGIVSAERSVTIMMNGPLSGSVYYAVQQPILKVPRAKMTLNKLRELPAFDITDDTQESPVKYTIPDTKKVLSVAHMPFGPERQQLKDVLLLLSEQDKSSPPKLSAFSKNFYQVVKNNDVDKVLKLLTQGFDPNHAFEENDGQRALHAAAANGNITIVHLLVQAGAELNAADKSLNTPLIMAVRSEKNNDVVRYLIKVGAAIDIKGEDGMTALHTAAQSGNLEAVRAILATGKISINAQDDGGWTALVWATEHKHVPLVKFLLSKGADPSKLDDEENVGLHWAAYSGEVNITYVLLEMGCDINVANMHGDTALHIAARRDNYECVM